MSEEMSIVGKYKSLPIAPKGSSESQQSHTPLNDGAEVIIERLSATNQLDFACRLQE